MKKSNAKNESIVESIMNSVKNHNKFTGIGGLLGSVPYKPLSEEELKKLNIDRVRNNLCMSIGKSVYIYQHLIDFIRQEVWNRANQKCSDDNSSEVFYTLVYNVSDTVLFEMFVKMFPYNLGKIMTNISEIRNKIIHSCYKVNEYGSVSEKPVLLKKSKKDQSLKQKLNINIDTMMTFAHIVLSVLIMIKHSEKQDVSEEIKTIKAEITDLNSELKKSESFQLSLARSLSGYTL